MKHVNLHAVKLAVGPRFLFLVLCSLSLLAALTLESCSDKALQQVAQASRDIAAANLAVENAVLSASQSGILTDAQARPFIQLHLQIGQAGLQLDSAIKGISALAPADKTKILAVLQPVIQAVNSAVAQTSLISNQTVKTDVLAALTTIQAALAVARVAVGG
jgi:hypothetical protein